MAGEQNQKNIFSEKTFEVMSEFSKDSRTYRFFSRKNV
jgi:hypothetical protein